MEEVKIRFTEQQDLQHLPWLYNQTYYGEMKVGTNYSGMMKKFNNLLKNEDYKFISAVIGEKVVGFCELVLNHNIFEQQKPMLMLWNLRVHPDYRKVGIGKSIILFVETSQKALMLILFF